MATATKSSSRGVEWIGRQSHRSTIMATATKSSNKKASGKAAKSEKPVVLTLEQQERELPPIKPEGQAGPLSGPELTVNQEIVQISKITVRKGNRAAAAFTRERLAGLMASIARKGLMQPIVVRRLNDGLSFELIAGQRRLEACKLLGHTSILCVERITDDPDGDRLTENVDREPLGFDEEADQVESIYAAALDADESVDGLTTKEQEDRAVGLVAGNLGKSRYWVRERLLIAGLDDEIRGLVRDGELSVSVARRLAMIQDKAERQQACKDVRNRFGIASFRGLPTDQEIDRIVGEYLYRLAGVAWQLDEPFAGKPACTSCPNNSANAPGLFTHLTRDGRPMAMFREGAARSEGVTLSPQSVPKAGVCNLGSCYRHKAAAAKAMIDKAATKAVTDLTQKAADSLKGVKASQLQAKTMERAIEMARPAAVKDLVPPGLDPQRVVERAKSKLERQADRGPSRPGAATQSKVSEEQDKAQREARNQAANDYVDFVRRVDDQVVVPVRQVLAKDLSKVLLLDLIMQTPAGRNLKQWNAQGRRKALASRETDQALAIAGMPLEKAFAELARLRFGKTGLSTYNPLELDASDAEFTVLGLWAKLAKVLGVAVPTITMPQDRNEWIAERAREILTEKAGGQKTGAGKAAAAKPQAAAAAKPKAGNPAVAPARKSSANTKAIGSRVQDDEEPPRGAGDVARDNQDGEESES
jgi:ParB/RepB/Spo0J family partition protein